MTLLYELKRLFLNKIKPSWILILLLLLLRSKLKMGHVFVFSVLAIRIISDLC